MFIKGIIFTWYIHMISKQSRVTWNFVPLVIFPCENWCVKLICYLEWDCKMTKSFWDVGLCSHSLTKLFYHMMLNSIFLFFFGGGWKAVTYHFFICWIRIANNEVPDHKWMYTFWKWDGQRKYLKNDCEKFLQCSQFCFYWC